MAESDSSTATSPTPSNGVLGEIARAVNHEPTAAEAVQRTAEALGSYFGHPLGIWLRESAEDRVRLEGIVLPERAPAGTEHRVRELYDRIPVDAELPGPIAMRARETVHVRHDDPGLPREAAELLAGLGADQYLAVPILTGDGPAGFAVMTPTRDGRTMDGPEEELLRSALGLLAIVYERVRHQERDRARAAELHTLARAIDHLPHAVKISSPDWTIRRVNPAVERILGYPPGELIGRPVEAIRWPEGSEETRREIEDALRAGSWTGEVLDRHREGHPVPVRATVVPVRDEAGELVAIVDIEQDLTEEKLREARIDAAYRLASIGELAAGVAHEVNNPLHAISGTAELLLMEDLPDDLRSDLEAIRREAKRGGTIIRNLLAFARPRPPEKEPLDLEEVVRSVVELRLPQLRLGGLEVELDVSPDTPHALADADQIRQILHNLIANSAHAVRETGADGRIVVRLKGGAGMAEVAVEDTGRGIPEEVRRRIFDPFFTTKRVGEGTGLGLSVSFRLAQEHDGELVAGNWGRPPVDGGAVGEGGARMVLRLPAAETEEVESEREGPPPSRPRVLVVDDDPTVASVARRFLTRAGFEVREVHRAEEAMHRILRGDPIDVLLLDLRMPGMGGETLYRKIEEERPELAERVIFMSGDIVTPRSHDFLRDTDRPVLAKPYELADLAAAAEEVAGR